MKDVYPLESETICYNDCIDLDTLFMDMCALSNAQGGTIYCGVNKKGKLIGVNPQFLVDELDADKISLKFNHQVQFSLCSILSGYRYIVLLKIECARNLVACVKNDNEKIIYIRLGQSSIVASKILIRWIQWNKNVIQNLTLDRNDSLELIIQTLNSNNGLTLSQVYKQIELSKSEIDQILPYLLHLNKINVKVINQKIHFFS